MILPLISQCSIQINLLLFFLILILP